VVGAFEISNQSELKMGAVESSVKQIKTRTNIGVQGGAKSIYQMLSMKTAYLNK
jgi:hypothetical protein